MGCEACNKFQASSQTSYFRWKTANIEIRACEQHLREVFEVLRKEMKEEKNHA